MPTRNVNLSDHFDSFISASIEKGRYDNASEAVGAGLRLLEQEEHDREAKIEWLRHTTQMAFAALDRGEGIRLASAQHVDHFVDTAIAEARTGVPKSHA